MLADGLCIFPWQCLTYRCSALPRPGPVKRAQTMARPRHKEMLPSKSPFSSAMGVYNRPAKTSRRHSSDKESPGGKQEAEATMKRRRASAGSVREQATKQPYRVAFQTLASLQSRSLCTRGRVRTIAFFHRSEDFPLRPFRLPFSLCLFDCFHSLLKPLSLSLCSSTESFLHLLPSPFIRHLPLDAAMLDAIVSWSIRS